MTDIVKGFTVTLKKDYRVDAIRNAISMISGVVSVDDVNVTGMDNIDRMRIKTELKGKIYNLLQDI